MVLDCTSPLALLERGRVRKRQRTGAVQDASRSKSVSEFPKIEFVPRDAEVFNDIRDDSARHVARMPRERDEPVGPKRIGIMPVTAGGAKEFAADFAESPLQLAAVVGRAFAHGSGSEDELVAERGRDGAAGFEQRFQMRFGRLLKAESGFASIAPVRVAAGQQVGLGNPHAVFVLAQAHFRERNDHRAETVTRCASGVKGRFGALPLPRWDARAERKETEARQESAGGRVARAGAGANRETGGGAGTKH